MSDVYEGFTDEELIDRQRSGERQITDYIMDKYKNLVRKKAKSMYILGADNDDLIQEHATGIATDMVCKFGMYEEEIGLAVIKDAEYQYDQKAKELINRILSEQLKEAIRIIESNKDAIGRLVKKVMENGKKYLTEKEILETAGKLNTDGAPKFGV